jgi:hypothetical protein
MPGEPCNPLAAVDGTVNVIALGVIMETLNIILAIVALHGVATEKRSFYIGWMIFLPIYIVYEAVTVILMIINLQSLVSNNSTLPALFTIFNLWGSGASSLTVQDNTDSTAGPQLSQAVISNINLPFITVIIFWFIQIIINMISEVAVVKKYRGEDYLRDSNPYNPMFARPPSRADLMYPYGYPSPAAMGYTNPAVAYPNNMMTRPYIAAYPSSAVPTRRQ